MIRVNLLPHREIRRAAQQKQFFIMLGIVVGIGIAIWGSVHVMFEDQFNNQVARNKYLQDEIEKLDRQIAEIQKLKDQTAALLARKRVVETLQSTRSEVVHLMDQLVRQLPDGVYLRSIKQSGTRVLVGGYTQSQARVSTLMRNLDSSPHLENPGLIEIKAATQQGQRLNEFNLSIGITRAAVQDDAKKPAPRPASKG
jgi:type IV pilus assembly protein PilN